MFSRSRSLIRRLNRPGYAADIRKVVTSAVFSQFIILACTPILTRLYSPADFGVLAVFVSILGVIPIVATFRYDVAISLSKDRQESYHILGLCLIGTILCTVAVAILFGTGSLAKTNSSLAQVQPYWWLVALGTFAVGVFTALNAWVGYAQEYSLVARVKVRQSLSSVIAQIALGLLTAGPLGLLIGYVISQSFGATSYANAVRRARPQAFRFRDIAAAAVKYRQFLFFAFPAGVINRLGLHIIPVLIGLYYSIAAAGFYLLAQRLVALPTLVIGRSVAQVYTNRLARDSLTGQTRLLRVYLKTNVALLTVGFVPMGLLAVVGPGLFSFVFGEEWRVAGVFCQILTPAFYAQFVVSPMIQTLNVLGYQKTQLVWDCARLLAIFAVFLVSDRHSYSQIHAVMAISATLCATYILQFLLSLWAIRRFDKRVTG